MRVIFDNYKKNSNKKNHVLGLQKKQDSKKIHISFVNIKIKISRMNNYKKKQKNF